MVQREWVEKEFYKVLGVSSDASDDEIRRVAKKLLAENHPDRNPDNPAAEDRYKEVGEARDVLTDKAKLWVVRPRVTAGTISGLDTFAKVQAAAVQQGSDVKIDMGGGDALLPHGRHLILHEGDERRDDHPQPFPAECRDLEAQRFAATGRHQHQA